MGKPVHLPAGRPVARVVAANAIPDATPSPEFMRKLDKLEPGQEPSQKMTIEDRQKLLLELLRKDGRLDKLKEWPPELALQFERMLMEHHNIFSLERNEIGCTDAAEHVIELLDTEPFKEHLNTFAVSHPHWLRKYGNIYKKCWTEARSGRPSPLGVTQWFWCAKKTGVSGFVSISAS